MVKLTQIQLQRISIDPVDPFKIFTELTLQIIIDAIFGGEFDAKWMSEQWHTAVTKNLVPYILSLTFFGNACNYFTALPKQMAKIRAKIQKVIDNKAKTTSLGTTGLFSKLLSTINEETHQPISNDIIVDECLTFLFAGHDTSSNLLTWAVYFLALHPDVQQKLFEEVTNVLKGTLPDTSNKIAELVYCKAIINETLRMRPPAACLARIALRDCELSGYKIPAGTRLCLNVYSLHHNSKYFENPHEFRPERFLNESLYNNRFAFLPFSAGAYNCLGIKFALQESIIILSMVCQKYELKIVDPTKKVTFSIAGILSAHGLEMKFVPRK